jgi:hypothetical protein
MFIALVFTITHRALADTSLELRYDQPASRWVEALPLGNGRLGAMVFGGIGNEHLQFNESTLWTGKPHEYQHEGAIKYLPRLRQLLNEGRQLELEAGRLEQTGEQKAAGEKRQAAPARQREAEAIAMKEFMSIPIRQQAYQFNLEAAVEVSVEAHFSGSTVEVLNKEPFWEERGNRSAFTCRVNDSNCGAVAMQPAEVADI